MIAATVLVVLGVGLAVFAAGRVLTRPVVAVVGAALVAVVWRQQVHAGRRTESTCVRGSTFLGLQVQRAPGSWCTHTYSGLS